MAIWIHLLYIILDEIKVQLNKFFAEVTLSNIKQLKFRIDKDFFTSYLSFFHILAKAWTEKLIIQNFLISTEEIGRIIDILCEEIEL